MIKNYIKTFRTVDKKSLEQVARAVGVNRSHISKIENGKRYPSAEIMFKIANYLKTTVDQLFKYEDDKEISKN